MTTTLVELAADLIRRAGKRGADAADAIAIDRFDIEVGIRDGKLERLEQAESREAGLRVFVGQSSAVISGSVLDGAGLDRLAEMAVAMARAAPPDPFAGIAAPAETAILVRDLDLEAKVLPEAAELEDWARRAEAVALAVPGVTKAAGSGASAARRTVGLATSNGFAGSYGRTSTGLSASVIAGTGTMMERDYEYSVALHPSDLKAPEEVGRIAGERAVKRLNARKIRSQAVPVVYDRRISSSLVGHLISAVLGSAIARRSSFLQDSLGQMIMPPGIEVADDPHMTRGLASHPFDGEGLAGSAIKIVTDGRLTSWLLDLHSSRQLGLKPTGHAARGISSPPSPSSSNAFMANGNQDLRALISDIRSGVYVTELIGMGVNLVTGDYSRGASGFWIENGELAYPVSEITVAGNLKDIFKRLTPANDLEFRSSTNAPAIRVEGMTVAGA
jgi:PmbA protein